VHALRIFKANPGLVLLLLLVRGSADALESPKNSPPGRPAVKADYLVYVGTFTGAKSKGIYVTHMNPVDGRLTPPTLAAETPNPSFLALDVPHRRLFAVNAIDDYEGQSAGSVSAFSIDPASGKLTLLGRQTSLGKGPCHLLLDRECRNVLVANYRGGSAAVLPLDANGRLAAPTTVVQHNGKGTRPDRQEGPHAHCVTLDTANRYAFVCDLGLDKVMIYRFDAPRGTLIPGEPPFASVPAGAGPRHMVFHPDGRHAYVINELNSTITVFAYDAPRGSLNEVQTLSTLPAGFDGDNTTAEIQVHPSGKFLFGSNRGHDSVAVFAIDPARGTLTLVQHQSTLGKKPRHFGIDPTGKFLLAANQDSDALVVFSIDPKTGQLKPTGHAIEVPSPVCVDFLPAGAALKPPSRPGSFQY
jgi:6-phosphogluconolactonase